MTAEAPHVCKKCSRVFATSQYSSTAICDACVEAVEPWKLRATGVGCLVISLASLAAGVGMIVGMYETIVDEGVMSVIGKRQIYAAVLLGLLGLGAFGIPWSVHIFRDAKGSSAEPPSEATDPSDPPEGPL